ncbi:uncharacterized protein V2V93DRAFT_369350 [Kockiozyma suomiensis]|uniref:uncharacterized protein n=1 Tax=Kockiozyma suomiensis TaxID=1337062 RepID=UPI00334348E5
MDPLTSPHRLSAWPGVPLQHVKSIRTASSAPISAFPLFILSLSSIMTAMYPPSFSSASSPPAYDSIIYDRQSLASKSPTSCSRGHRKSKSRQLASLDYIDSMDDSMLGNFHHEGPFDATMMYRNSGVKYPPVKAVRQTNIATLNATAPGSIADAIENHIPLDGIAVVPPGSPGRPDGLDYEEEVISELDSFQQPMLTGTWPGAEFATAGRSSSVETSIRKRSNESSRSKRSSLGSVKSTKSSRSESQIDLLK